MTSYRPMLITIVLPAFNEAKRLRKTVEEVVKAAEKTGYDYEIIIAEDGSTDGTDRIAAEIARENEKIVHLHSPDRLGRGKALKNAFKVAKGDVLVYMDVDLATDLSHLKELVDAIAVEGYDFATGSRLMKESRCERPLKRELASKGYNFLVRLFLGSKLRDHQCGFKAFRKDAVMDVLEDVEDNHWFWDTEVLVLAQKKGYRVKEIPVRWRHGGETKVEMGRDVGYMFGQIMRMWLREKRSSRKYVLATFAISFVLLIALAYFAGVDRIYTAVVRLNPYYLLLSSVIYASSYLLRGYRFSYILSRLDYDCGTAFSSGAVSIGQMVNVVTPVRIGDVARAYVFKKINVPYTSSLGAVAVERMFDLVSVAVIATISAIMLGMGVNEPIYAVIFALVIVLLIFALSRMENMIGRVFRNAKRVLGVKEAVIITALSSLIWLSDIAVCYIIASSYLPSALGFAPSTMIPSTFLYVSLAVSVANIVKALPITPGGIGTYEAAMTAILSNTFSQSVAFVISLVDHAVKNIVTLILGFISMAALNVHMQNIRGVDVKTVKGVEMENVKEER